MSQKIITHVIQIFQLRTVGAKMFLSITACVLMSCAPIFGFQGSFVSNAKTNVGQSPPRVCIENYVGWCFLRGDLNIRERKLIGSTYSSEWTLTAPWLEAEIRFQEGAGCRQHMTDEIVNTDEGIKEFEGREWDYLELQIFDGCRILAMAPSNIYPDRRLLRSALGLIRFCFDVECRSSGKQNDLISSIN